MSKCYDEPDISGEVEDIKEHLQNIRRRAPKCTYDIEQITEILDDLVTCTDGDNTETEIFFGDIAKGDIVEFRHRVKVASKQVYSAGPMVYGHLVHTDGGISNKYIEFPIPRSEDERKLEKDKYHRQVFMVDKAKTPEELLKEDLMGAGFSEYDEEIDSALAFLKAQGWTFSKPEKKGG